MTTSLKLRRGTTAQHATFTGAEGEVTVDTTKDTVVVHDGATAGGFPLAKRSDLTAPNTFFTQSGTGAVARTVDSKIKESVSLKDFGAVGDGVTNDAVAIQNAIKYAFANGFDVKADGATYAVNSTILIPQNSPSPTFEKARKISLDFGNSIFKMLSDVTLFESAYDNSGTLTTNYGTALDSHYSVQITLTNFGVESNVGQLTNPTLKIQDWHQQCEITNVTSSVSQQMLWANNCYYMSVDNISAGIIAPKAGNRFTWFGNTNLCKISRLVAANSVIGYRFTGGVTATQLTNMSIEGQTKGVVFEGSVYDVLIENSYMEGFSDVAISFESYVEGATIRNNYVNFLSSASSYLVYYQPLPGCNIRITDDNNFTAMPSDSNIIKNREDTYGAGLVIERHKVTASTLGDFLVDPTKVGRNVDWRQKKLFAGVLGNTVNVLVPGNYAGKFSDGYSSSNGFTFVSTGANTLLIRTKVTQNYVQFVYVNIEVAFSGGPTYIKGVFIGNQFYKAGASGLDISSDLTGGTDANGYFQIDGGYYFAATVTGCKGEVRMI